MTSERTRESPHFKGVHILDKRGRVLLHIRTHLTSGGHSVLNWSYSALSDPQPEGSMKKLGGDRESMDLYHFALPI